MPADREPQLTPELARAINAGDYESGWFHKGWKAGYDAGLADGYRQAIDQDREAARATVDAAPDVDRVFAALRSVDEQIAAAIRADGYAEQADSLLSPGDDQGRRDYAEAIVAALRGAAPSAAQPEPTSFRDALTAIDALSLIGAGSAGAGPRAVEIARAALRGADAGDREAPREYDRLRGASARAAPSAAQDTAPLCDCVNCTDARARYTPKEF